MSFNLAPPQAIAPGLPVHRSEAGFAKQGLKVGRLSPAQILRLNHGRRPLDCTAGTVTVDLAAAQAAGAAGQWRRAS